VNASSVAAARTRRFGAAGFRVFAPATAFGAVAVVAVAPAFERDGVLAMAVDAADAGAAGDGADGNEEDRRAAAPVGAVSASTGAGAGTGTGFDPGIAVAAFALPTMSVLLGCLDDVSGGAELQPLTISVHVNSAA
jgi:hypothetical protein